MARTKQEIAETGPKDPSEVDVTDIPSNREDAPELTACIERASEALGRKAEILAAIQECRQYGTMTMNMGRGSREQVAWLRFYLPRKTRKVNGQDVEVEDGEE